MSVNNLTGSSPAATRAQLLHIGTGTADTFTMRLGDGTATPLVITPEKINYGSVGVISPSLLAVVNADVTGIYTSATNVPLTWINGSVLTAGKWLVEAKLLTWSAATTTGARMRLYGPSGQTSYMAGDWSLSNILATAVYAWGADFLPASAPVANTPFLTQFTGVVAMASNGATAPTIDLWSEVSASDVKILAGSVLRFTKIG